MSRESSDKLAAEASRILAPSRQLLPDDVVDQIIDGVGKAINRDEARSAVRTALQPLTHELRSLAGSVMSQADGPE